MKFNKYIFILILIILSAGIVNAKTYDFSDEAYNTFRNEYKRINIPSGAVIYSRLNDNISSEQNSENEVLITQLVRDWKYNGQMVAPEGSLIKGKIIDIRNAGFASGNAKVNIIFSQIIKPDNSTIYIQSKPICVTIGDSRLASAGKNMLTGVLESVGSFTTSPRTIATNAVAGAITGGFVFMTTKGQEVTIPFGTEFRIQILNNISVMEYEN